jgi:hypothetical protein
MPRNEVEALLSASPPLTPPPPRESPPAKAPLPIEPVITQPATSVTPPPAAETPITDKPQSIEVRPLSPKPLGKGGEEHKRLQLLVKQWAQGMGYRATIEERLASGGVVDVSLQKPQRMIACEISVTTPNVNEVENVRKCLTARYDFVAMLSTDSKRIASLERAITPKLTKVEQAKVRFFSTPDDLFTFVEELDAKDMAREQTVRGYRVRVRHQVVDKTSKAEKGQIIAKVVAGVLKRART